MKIERVRVTRVSLPRVDTHWRTSSYAASSVDGFVLEVEADGLVGVGGTAAHPSRITPDDLQAQLNGPVRERLIGGDAFAGGDLRAKLKRAGLAQRAILAADLALHDLLGKAAGLPCYVLWGGAVRTDVAVVRMVGIKPPGELVDTVRGLLDAGFGHLKVKIGTGLLEDVERIRVLRETFGAGVWIAVDANGAYTPEGAIELSRALERYEVKLVEQPVADRDLDGLARVTAASAIPIMADQFVEDAATALEACQRRACHVVSIKASKMGSIDECRRVAEICHAFGIRVHIGGTAVPAVVDAAQAQLALATPGIDPEAEVGEFMAVSGDPTSGLVIRDGRVHPSDAPGLGIQVAVGAPT